MIRVSRTTISLPTEVMEAAKMRCASIGCKNFSDYICKVVVEDLRTMHPLVIQPLNEKSIAALRAYAEHKPHERIAELKEAVGKVKRAEERGRAQRTKE